MNRTPPSADEPQREALLFPYRGPRLQWAKGQAQDEPDGNLELSLIAPVYNEAGNLRRLHARVCEVFGERLRFELVLVDDGSSDESAALIRELAAADSRVRGVFFARNCGQTSAVAAGIHFARGRLLATLDADLQNDPADLPAMLERLGDNDAVVGYRLRRQDNFVRRISSRIANKVRNWVTQDSIRDTGCSLKLFRAEAIRAVPLFEGLHRFLPTLLRYYGFQVLEHPVSHHPRTAGQSKYGLRNRAWRATKDLFAVRWMRARRMILPVQEVVGGGVPGEKLPLQAGHGASPKPHQHQP